MRSLFLTIALSLPLPVLAQGEQGSSSSSSQAASKLEPPAGLFGQDKRSRDVLAAQVMLDRSRHSPGVIDGYMGGNTSRAIQAYREANGLAPSGGIDKALLDHLRQNHGGDLFRSYTVAESDVTGPFPVIPSGFAAKADLDKLGYETPLELLAEKFHMTEGLLEALNPGVAFAKAGTEILVTAKGDDTLNAKVARVVVVKGGGAVRAFDASGKLLASYPATIGSDTFPSPDGSMTVNAVASQPKYYFDPEGRNWGPDRTLTIAAGPNNPVGGTWIDLSKEGYGIHGSPDPQMVGKRTSHGCVRLTNWDAEELAKAVGNGTTVEFQ